MPTTTTRLTAWASTEGEPAMIVLTQHVDDLGTDDEYIAGYDDDQVASRPLPLDEDGVFAEDLDVVLAEMGYRRTQEWENTPDGGVVVVEPR